MEQYRATPHPHHLLDNGKDDEGFLDGDGHKIKGKIESAGYNISESRQDDYGYKFVVSGVFSGDSALPNIYGMKYHCVGCEYNTTKDVTRLRFKKND